MSDWTTTYHFPDGQSRIESHVPPCVCGPLTDKYLAKYAAQIAQWKGHRDSIGGDDTPKPEGATF